MNLRKNFNIYFFSFFMYCIIGWLYEVLLELFVYNHGFVNRGFLYGPYLPVYGFGAIILIFLLKNDFHETYSSCYIEKTGINYCVSMFLYHKWFT